MDLTFNATDIGYENGDGTSGIVYGCAVQPMARLSLSVTSRATTGSRWAA